jgi:hypothetical protein
VDATKRIIPLSDEKVNETTRNLERPMKTSTCKENRDVSKQISPGPWTTGCGKNGTIAILAMEWETRLVANVSTKDRSSEEADANANLMAAAPELLAACRAMLEQMQWDAVDRKHFANEMARKAIAKAEGK